MTRHCLTDFFGMCVQSEAEARDLIIAWGIGSATGLGVLLACFVGHIVGARASLKFIRIVAFSASVVTGISVLLAYVGVLLDYELKQFVVAYGYQSALALLAASLTAGWFGKQLESTVPETLGRDAIVCGSVGSFLVIGAAFTAAVMSVWTQSFFLFLVTVFCIGLTFLGVGGLFWADSRSHLTA